MSCSQIHRRSSGGPPLSSSARPRASPSTALGIPTASAAASPGSRGSHSTRSSRSEDPAAASGAAWEQPSTGACRIGLYGVSGAGKTHWLESVTALPSPPAEARGLLLFEGADEVCRAAGVPSRAAFRALPAQQQEEVRRLALRAMRDRQSAEGSADVLVCGHHTLCIGMDKFTGKPTLETVWTDADAGFYTAIVYLTADPTAVSARLAARAGDRRRHLPAAAVAAWQEAELRAVKASCEAAGIRLVVSACAQRGVAEARFPGLFPNSSSPAALSTDAEAQAALAAALPPGGASPECFLIIDADGTLFPGDTGRDFATRAGIPDEAVRACFSRGGAYGCRADFERLAALFASVPPALAEAAAAGAAAAVSIDPQWLEFLWSLRLRRGGVVTPVVVLTAGMERVWRAALDRHGLGWVPLIATQCVRSANGLSGGTGAPPIIVSAELKAAVARALRRRAGASASSAARVIAFGDSPVDLQMACEADLFVAVPPPAGHASKSRAAFPAEVAARVPGARLLQLDGRCCGGAPAVAAAAAGGERGGSAAASCCAGAGAGGASAASGSSASPPLKQQLPPPVTFAEIAASLLVAGGPPAGAGAAVQQHAAAGRSNGGAAAPTVVHFTSHPHAQALAAKSRDKRIHGPALCGVHEQIGRFLFSHAVAQLLPLRHVAFEGVQGPTGGFAFDDTRVTVVSLERGGACERCRIPPLLPAAPAEESETTGGRAGSDRQSEGRINRFAFAHLPSLSTCLLCSGGPLARGIWDHLPKAAYFARHKGGTPPDAKLVAGRVVVICDSVVNSGESLIAAVTEVLSLKPQRVVACCAVLQRRAGPRLAAAFPLLPVVALRVSGNSFKGHGGTDTSHRLFNTEVLDAE